MAFTKIATINKTFERCQAENIGISKHLIRQLASSGQIPSIMAGKTRLINYDLLLDFLNNGTVQTPQSETAGHIKPIPKRILIMK
ncbi:MAG: hypothetical protein PHG06_17715 [Parabacteroides sp.]|nr:hypothetical protein [Parabacteroides sp.]